uniref:Uncharacterized protein n=1 Tax=Aquisalinus luteolus TaxID=1566827 RepID=A0A8J3A480_9PROT|nr:hypothetical protein GCM10011355_19310 [Aquisalinus luteolus]
MLPPELVAVDLAITQGIPDTPLGLSLVAPQFPRSVDVLIHHPLTRKMLTHFPTSPKGEVEAKPLPSRDAHPLPLGEVKICTANFG